MKYIAIFVLVLLVLMAAIAWSNHHLSSMVDRYLVTNSCVVVNDLCIIDGKVIIG